MSKQIKNEANLSRTVKAPDPSESLSMWARQWYEADKLQDPKAVFHGFFIRNELSPEIMIATTSLVALKLIAHMLMTGVADVAYLDVTGHLVKYLYAAFICCRGYCNDSVHVHAYVCVHM